MELRRGTESAASTAGSRQNHKIFTLVRRAGFRAGYQAHTKWMRSCALLGHGADERQNDALVLPGCPDQQQPEDQAGEQKYWTDQQRHALADKRKSHPEDNDRQVYENCLY